MKQKFLERVRKIAAKNPARIVFPETFDPRTLEAVDLIVKAGTAHPVLIGGPKKDGCETIDLNDSARLKKYAARLFELRKNKGLTLAEAQKLVRNRNYFGVMVVESEEADGLISGANCPSADTLRPALQVIGTKEKFHKVSGFFFMVFENRVLLFADCMVNIEPNSTELAEIAIDSAATAMQFGIEPRIAMLSFSTNGSAKHPSVDRMREAVKMVNYKRPDLICEGEMQVDAALVQEVCKRKFPKSRVPGNANVLIFPNLDAANISYKLVERLARAEAIGPIIQGLRKPINDLSRGCSVNDIVELTAITSVEAQKIPVTFN